jgi:WD40 repeat protein
VSGSDETVRVWELNTGKLLNTLKGHTNIVSSLAVTSDNSKIVSGSTYGTIKVWELNTGKLLKTLKGHSDYVNCVAITSDNSKIVSGSYDQTIKVWDLDKEKYYLRYRFDCPILCTTISKNGNMIIVGNSSGSLYTSLLKGRNLNMA